MHDFVQNRSKSNQLFLFLFFYSVTLSGMEVVVAIKEPVVSTNRRSRQPDCIFPIFDPKKEFKSGTPWSDVVPGIIKITPDGNGVVLGQHGVVKHALFDKKDVVLKAVIEFPCAKKYTPMIAVSQRKNGSLLIISASNYTNSENKRVAECIAHCNESFTNKKLDWFVQAISSDACGRMYAIAGQHSVMVVDFETNKTSEASFKCLTNNENWIADIAMNPEGKAVIAAGNHGEIQWMSLSRDNHGIVLSNLKQVMVKDDIKNIYYPDSNQLFYVMQGGNIKTITMENLLTINGEDVTTTDFGGISAGDTFVADSNVVAKLFLPKDKVFALKDTGLQQETVSIIEVLRKNNEKDEKTILEVPSLHDRYNYITELGQRASAIGHLLDVTMSGNVVVGLATDGSMRVWELPHNHIIRSEDTKETVEKTELDSVAHIKETKTKRGRSGSGRDIKHSLVSSDDGEGEKKKVSPRKNTLVSSDEVEGEKKKPSPRELIQKFKFSGSGSGSGSKDLSPPRSQKGSEEKL